MQKMDESTHMTKRLWIAPRIWRHSQRGSASTQEVGSASHELAGMAEQLRMMREFKLN